MVKWKLCGKKQLLLPRLLAYFECWFWGKDVFLFSKACKLALSLHNLPLSALYPVVKRLGPEAGHSSYTAEAKNGWTNTPPFPYAFIASTWKNHVSLF